MLILNIPNGGQWLSYNIMVTFFCVSELSRLKDEEISAAAIKAQFEKQLLTERTLKTQVCVITLNRTLKCF